MKYKINKYLWRTQSELSTMIQKFIKKLLGKEELGVLSKNELKTYLPENPIILEAGASNGLDTLELSKVFPKATIHAFEPIPDIFKTLHNRVKDRKNVITYPVALSEQTGEATIHVSSGKTDGASSLLKPKEHLNFHGDVHFEQEITVPTITLDDWAAQNNIQKVDFMWLDMQGMEFNVLQASNVILDTVQVIYTEVSLIETYEGVKPYSEYKEWFLSKGFIAEKELLPWKDMGNVLFVRK